MGAQRVLGAAVMARLRALEAVAGGDVVSRARATLAPDVREALTSVRAIAWVPLESVEALTDAVATALGRQPERFHDEIMRRSVDDAFGSIYRFVLTLASDDWLVARTPQIFRRTREIGDLVSEIHAPGRARLVLTGWPRMRDRYARQVAIGVERLLTLTGRREVRIAHSLTPDGATFDATWRAR